MSGEKSPIIIMSDTPDISDHKDTYISTEGIPTSSNMPIQRIEMQFVINSEEDLPISRNGLLLPLPMLKYSRSDPLISAHIDNPPISNSTKPNPPQSFIVNPPISNPPISRIPSVSRTPQKRLSSSDSQPSPNTPSISLKTTQDPDSTRKINIP